MSQSTPLPAFFGRLALLMMLVSIAIGMVYFHLQDLP